MFSLPWSRPKPERFSLENLKLLCKQLQSFSPDARKEPIITCLKELTQILIWGDQHDPMLLEYSEAIKFFNHEESMIRIAVRVITLNVYGVDDQQMQDFILDRTTTTYFSNLVWFIGNYGTTINDILLHPSEGEMSRIDYYLAEHLDCFYYINDIVELEVPKINKILISFVLNRLLRPIYIQSLLPSSAQGSTNIVKSAFAYAPLVSALATTIFANQQHGVAHTGHPHPIQSLQQAAGLSPGSSRSSSPASTSRIHSPLALMTSSPSGKHQPPLHPTKEPARAFPATTSSQRAPSRKSSFSDSKIPAGATATQPSCPPSTLVANPYKAVIFGYLSQTENDRLVLPTLLLIYLTCHNTGVMADMLMGTDIYPQRLLKSRVLMGNLMSSSSSLFGPGSGSRAAAGGARADSTPMARGFSADSSMPVHPMHGGVHRDQQNQQHPSLDHTISLSLGSPTSSATTTAITTAAVGVTDGKPHLKTLQPRGGGLSVSAGTGAGGLAGSGVGRSTRTESPLFENSEDDEESRETEELLAGVLPNDVSLPPSPNPLNDSGGAIHGMLMTGGGGDTKSPSSSRALSIRSHVSSSSLGGQGHLPMPQLPSPKVRQTQAFFPSTSVSSSPTPTAQAAVAALSTAITPAMTAPSSPHLDELETTRDDGDGGQVHPSPSRVPPPLPPRRLGHGTDGDDDDDDDADPRASMTSSAFPLLPVVQNREELIQRLLDIVTCAGRWDSKEPTPTASPAPGATPSKPPLLASPTSASAHRFRIVTIQVAAELLLEFVYVKGGVPAGSTAAGGGETPMQAKRRASSGAIPSVSRLMSSEGGASSPSSERPAALRVCENMLTEEQLQQILEAENYFRERVRRGVEYLSQDLPGPPKETGNALGKAAADEFLPLGVKTREVERALQQTKLGLEKKVAGMLGDSKLLYGPPPEGDPNVDLDPDQVHDILANIDLRPPEIAPLEHGKDRALGTTEVMTGKESVGRAGRRTSRHLSMDRQQTHGGSGHSSPGVGYQSANQNNNNVNNPRRGRSISRNRLTAFMEDLGSGVFMIGNNTGIRKPTSAGSSSSSLVYP
ncbi:Protein CL16A, partial [Actinomortierella ambigua]